MSNDFHMAYIDHITQLLSRDGFAGKLLNMIEEDDFQERKWDVLVERMGNGR